MALVYIRPDADIVDGSWVNESANNTNLYDSLNETSPVDTDFIRSSNNPANDIVTLRLSNFGSTVTQPMTVRYRYKAVSSSGDPLSLKVRLIQGAGGSPATTIAAWRHSDAATTYQDASQLLTTNQFNAITDFTDLFLEFEAITGALEISALELLSGETQGFAIDATDIVTPAYVGGLIGGSVAVIDTGTPANDLSDVPMDAANLTQNGTSPKMVQWNSSPYARWTPHNFITDSQAISSWTNAGSTSVTADSTVAPDGTTTADTITATATSSNFRYRAYANFVINVVYTVSVYAKPGTVDWIWTEVSDFGGRGSGNWFNVATGTVGSKRETGGGTVTSAGMEAVGGGWYRCWLVTGPFSSSGTYNQMCAPADADADTITDNGESAIFWGAQVNRGPIATPYLVTTSAARIGIPQEYDTAASKYGILVEPAATNLCLYSDDFTNAAWTKSNMTTAKTATGPDNGTNSASTLTATAGNATALQAITSASSARITSMWVKRRTGTGNIDITQNNGTNWTTVTVTADWTRVELAAATLTDPTVGIRIVTSGDAIDVFGFQHETGSVVTSTIPTVAATVTRAGDDIGFLFSSIPWSTTAGTVGVLCQFRSALVQNDIVWHGGVAPYTGSPHIIRNATVPQFAIFGDAGANTNFASNPTVDTETELKVAFESGHIITDIDGSQSAVNTDAFTIGSNTRFCLNHPDDLTSYNPGVVFHKLVYVPRRVADASLTAWSF